MASASAGASVLPPVRDRLVAAYHRRGEVDRALKALREERVRLCGRADAQRLCGRDRDDFLVDCQRRLVHEEERLLSAERAVAVSEEKVDMHSDAEQSAPVSSALFKLLRSRTALIVESPAKRDDTLLTSPYAHFTPEIPLTVNTELTSAHLKSFGKLPDVYSAGLEATYLQEALRFLPTGVEIAGRSGGSGKVPASRLFESRGCQDPPFVKLPWGCFPELAVRSCRGYPGFNAELKTLPSVAWNEVLTYVTMSMLDSLFPVHDARHVYHFQPPVGYALLAVGGSAFFTAVEWVARLFIGLITEAFALGTEQHKEYVDKLCMNKR
eukprot:contig_20119_g4949